MCSHAANNEKNIPCLLLPKAEGLAKIGKRLIVVVLELLGVGFGGSEVGGVGGRGGHSGHLAELLAGV